MRLFEEFKEYEELWEATSDSFLKAFGRKKYDLMDPVELDKYITDLAWFQNKRNPDSYGSAYSETAKHSVTVGLLNNLKSQNADQAVIDRVEAYLNQHIQQAEDGRKHRIQKIKNSIRQALFSDPYLSADGSLRRIDIEAEIDSIAEKLEKDSESQWAAINASSARSARRDALGEDLKLSSKLQEAESSDITIIGCDIEETIDHMEKWGRCPKLPFGWFIDDIDETDSDSRIMFSHRRLPLGICFYCKYYMGSSYDQCKYEFSYYISIDGAEFDHAVETFDLPSPEDFIKRIFGIVTEFDNIFEDSTEKNFVKNLRAAGYKRHK
jgi:hypothetical protein